MNKLRIIIILVFVFSSCVQSTIRIDDRTTMTNMSFSIYDGSTGYQPRLFLSFPGRENHIMFTNQVKNVEYKGGWVKIGNELFTFDIDEVNIFLVTARHYSDRFANYLYMENGVQVISEEEKSQYLYYLHRVQIVKYIKKSDLRRIIFQNKKNIEVFFEYSLLFGDDLINVTINENYTYTVNHRILTIMDYK